VSQEVHIIYGELGTSFLTPFFSFFYLIVTLSIVVCSQLTEARLRVDIPDFVNASDFLALHSISSVSPSFDIICTTIIRILSDLALVRIRDLHSS